MRRYLLLFFFLTLGNLQAQNLVPYTKNKLWGYCDLQKKVVIPPTYKKADFFQNGLARVKSAENNLYGIINEKGEVIVPFAYKSSKELGNYAQDRIFFKKGELFGYFNGKGDVVIDPQFDFVYDFADDSPNIPARKNGRFGIIDTKGNTVLPFNYPVMSKPGASGYVTFFTDKGNGVMDLDGNIIVPALYREKKMHKKEPLPQLKQNFARIFRKDGAKDKAVIFNNGKELFYYLAVDNFDNEHFDNHQYLLVKKPNPGAFNGAMNVLVDVDGNPVLTWDNYPFTGTYNDQAIVIGKKKGSDIIYGLINTKGETILKPKYDKIGQFDENGIARFEYKGKTGFLSDQGKIVQTEKQFDGITSFGFSNNGLIYFKGDKGDGIMTYEGQVLFTNDDQYRYSFTDFGLVLRKNKSDKKETLLDRTGKVVTDEYSSISSRKYGFQVKSDQMKGILSKTGEVIFPAIYQNIDYVSEGYFITKKDNRKSLTDLLGKPILNNSYKDIRLIRGTDNFWVKNLEIKWQVINQKGEPISDNLYSEIAYFRDGLYNVRADNWGLVDFSGKEVVPTICKRAIEYVKSDQLLGIIRQGSVIYGYIGKDFTCYWE